MIKDFILIGEVKEKLIKEYGSRLPIEIIDIWKNYGFGTFYNGYLKVINPNDYIRILDESYFQGNVSIPIFATAFGDLITWEKNQFIGIVQYRYGKNEVISDGFDFFFDDLYDGELDKDFFDINQYEKAISVYGSLNYDECFGYVPLLGLGGKETVENLKIVKLREHIELIAEMTGEI